MPASQADRPITRCVADALAEMDGGGGPPSVAGLQDLGELEDGASGEGAFAASLGHAHGFRGHTGRGGAEGQVELAGIAVVHERGEGGAAATAGAAVRAPEGFIGLKFDHHEHATGFMDGDIADLRAALRQAPDAVVGTGSLGAAGSGQRGKGTEGEQGAAEKFQHDGGFQAGE